MTLVGIGYRKELHDFIKMNKSHIDVLELTAEHFYGKKNRTQLKYCKNNWPIILHSISLSLGSPEAFDALKIRDLKQLVRTIRPKWISEHLAITETSEYGLGHLNPVYYNQDSLNWIIKKLNWLKAEMGVPVLIENITSHIAIDQEIEETDFINQLCKATSSGILLDIANLYVNSRNHNFCPYEYIDALNLQLVKQLHVVGSRQCGSLYYDSHDQNIQTDIVHLANYVQNRIDLDAIIIERDGNFPDEAEMLSEIEKMKANQLNRIQTYNDNRNYHVPQS